MSDARVTMRTVLKKIHRAATDEAADIMTHPTWSLDYSLEFKLTVKELREIHAFLSTRPKRKIVPESLHCGPMPHLNKRQP